jgi:alkanesulfonate monooxygenase SsuD/methylene tetrahydromethanopterin reductase-like flavin-dependent oxidoreductase (luciferase family)
MEVGVVVVQNLAWPTWRDRVLRVEELGYTTAYVWDHLVHRTQGLHDPLFDGFGLLAGIAPLTTRLRLGTMVASPTLRHPLLLAKHAVTVDRISGGRLTLGIGAAGVARDYQALGMEPWSKGEQVDRFRETVEMVDVALRGGSAYAGRYYSGSEFSVAPGPVQQPRPPLTLAAHGPRTLRIAAQHADTWNSITPRDLTRDDALRSFDERSTALATAADELGRDPASIARSVFVGSDAWPALASATAFRDAALAYAERGVSEIVLPHPDHPAEAALGHGPCDPHLVERLADGGVLAELRALA